MQFQRYNFILQILLLVVASSLLILIASKHSTRFNSEKDLLESNSMATLGGLRNSLANSVEIDDLGRFAVQEHNKKENAMLELSRVIKAHEQVVAGTMHHLTLEVVDAGKKKICEAKVWVKPWMDFKELHEFKHIDEKDNEGSGYESVPVHDPVVLDAANHIIKTLQQRSKSLFPYELQEVVHAKAETGEGSTKYDILVKLKRNEKEEKFKANVHKDNNGVFHVNNMEQDHS